MQAMLLVIQVYRVLAKYNSDVIKFKKVQKLDMQISIIIIYGQRLTNLIA